MATIVGGKTKENLYIYYKNNILIILWTCNVDRNTKLNKLYSLEHCVSEYYCVDGIQVHYH